VVKPSDVYISAQQIKVSLTYLCYRPVFFIKNIKLAALGQPRGSLEPVFTFWPGQSGSPSKEQKT